MELNKRLFYQISVLHRVFRKEAQQALSKELDVTLEMLSVLQVLAELGSMSQQKLADILMIEKSSMKRNIDKMLLRDYVTTSADELSKKVKLISISEAGRQVRLTGRKIMMQAEDTWLASMPESEQHNLLKAISSLIEARTVANATP